MPIKKQSSDKGEKSNISSKEAAGQKAKDTFSAIGANRFDSLPQTSETISFRVPKGEKLRLTNLFSRHGLTRTEAIKKAVYKFAKDLEAE